TNTWNSIPEGRRKLSHKEYNVAGEHITAEREDIFTENYRVMVCDYNVHGKMVRDVCITRLVAPVQLCEQLMKNGFKIAEKIERDDGKRVFLVAQKV
ncbi:hypothetical protein HZB03_04430, partial [Candidatus Woesearchaeota archaeon]|nr:hypothetical protein [Candidatus Woesearchaeota archaeon]